MWSHCFQLLGFIYWTFISVSSNDWKAIALPISFSEKELPSHTWHPGQLLSPKIPDNSPGIKDSSSEVTEILEDGHGILQFQDLLFLVFKKCQGKTENNLRESQGNCNWRHTMTRHESRHKARLWSWGLAGASLPRALSSGRHLNWGRPPGLDKDLWYRKTNACGFQQFSPNHKRS